jgi:hypothetical protein
MTDFSEPAGREKSDHTGSVIWSGYFHHYQIREQQNQNFDEFLNFIFCALSRFFLAKVFAWAQIVPSNKKSHHR